MAEMPFLYENKSGKQNEKGPLTQQNGGQCEHQQQQSHTNNVFSQVIGGVWPTNGAIQKRATINRVGHLVEQHPLKAPLQIDTQQGKTLHRKCAG